MTGIAAASFAFLAAPVLAHNSLVVYAIGTLLVLCGAAFFVAWRVAGGVASSRVVMVSTLASVAGLPMAPMLVSLASEHWRAFARDHTSVMAAVVAAAVALAAALVHMFMARTDVGPYKRVMVAVLRAGSLLTLLATHGSAFVACLHALTLVMASRARVPSLRRATRRTRSAPTIARKSVDRASSGLTEPELQRLRKRCVSPLFSPPGLTRVTRISDMRVGELAAMRGAEAAVRFCKSEHVHASRAALTGDEQAALELRRALDFPGDSIPADEE